MLILEIHCLCVWTVPFLKRGVTVLSIRNHHVVIAYWLRYVATYLVSLLGFVLAHVIEAK